MNIERAFGRTSTTFLQLLFRPEVREATCPCWRDVSAVPEAANSSADESKAPSIAFLIYY